MTDLDTADHLTLLVGDELQARPANRVRSALLSREELATLPQPEPLISDTLDKRTVALLAGRRSTGKSFLALDWACCIATGKPWQARPVTDPGPVLYIAAEGAYGLDQRVEAWEYAWQHKATGLHVLPLPVNLFKGGTLVDELLTVIREDRPRLVVIDTWARSTVGGKENDNTDSTLAFEQVDRIRRLDTTVLLLAHTTADDTKTRGASALEDNVDTVYRIKGDARLLELERTKRKDGPPEDWHRLALQTVPLPAGDQWDRSSCVVQNLSGHEAAVSGRTADVLSTYDSTFLDIGCTKNELRAACHEAGISSSGTFSRALSTLISNGQLTNTGTDARPFYKAGPAHE